MNLGAFGFGAKSEPINGIIGSGSVPKIPKFTAANTIGDSQMSDNGTTVFIGASATSAKAAFEVNSTTKGVFLPRVTTAEQTAIGAGATDTSLLMFNTTNNRYEFYNHADTSYKRLLIPEDLQSEIFILTTESSHTGTTTETNLNSILIPANTFQVGDIVEAYYGVAKIGSAGNAQFRIRVSTTQGSIIGNGVMYQIMANNFMSNQRTFKVNVGGGLSGYNTSNTITTFFGVNNFDKATRTVGVADWTINQYLNISVLLADATDIFYIEAIYIKRYRP